MRNDAAMIMIDRMLNHADRGKATAEPIDPALRATVSRLLGEIRAIDFRHPPRQERI